MTIGRVDDNGRALIRLKFRLPGTSQFVEWEAQIDTGFSGHIWMGDGLAKNIGVVAASVNAVSVLADGSRVEVPTGHCEPEWFGTILRPRVILGGGNIPLIGIGLIEDCRLTIDYPRRTVQLEMTDPTNP